VKGWTGLVHLPREDVREAPTTKQSFLAGETERDFVFEITNWDTWTLFITVLRICLEKWNFCTYRCIDFMCLEIVLLGSYIRNKNLTEGQNWI
jgi:hypothetical protein